MTCQSQQGPRQPGFRIHPVDHCLAPEGVDSSLSGLHFMVWKQNQDILLMDQTLSVLSCICSLKLAWLECGTKVNTNVLLGMCVFCILFHQGLKMCLSQQKFYL